MPSFNQWIGVGHLTRDVDLKYLPSQTPLAEFGMACNRRYKTSQGGEREDVLFIDCKAFGKMAETLQKYAHKGSALFVCGRLAYDSWEDRNGGGKRSKISVVVENFQFTGGRDDGAKQDDVPPAGKEPYPRDRRSARQAPITSPPFDEGQHFKDDDIPFPVARR